MKLRIGMIALAALLVPLTAVPAAAQDFRSAFGIYGGGIWFSDLNRGDGSFADTPAADLTLETTWIAGLQAETWARQGRVGFRLNAGYSNPAFERGEGGITPAGSFGSVNTYLADLDLLFRLGTPAIDRRVAPFLGIGLGLVHYNPAGRETISLPPQDVDVVFGDPTKEDPNRATEFAIVPSLGIDIIPATRRTFFRIELADHIALNSPAMNAIAPQDDYGAVHNVRLTLGLHGMIGTMFAPAQVVTAPTPPTPPAAPATPPPAYTEITICVIDPTASGGIREQRALFFRERGDTMVVANGDTVVFRAMLPSGQRVVREADWFIQGQPLALEFETAPRRVEYTAFGLPRVVGANEVELIGWRGGVPVYVPRGDAPQLVAARRDAAQGVELATLVRDRPALRTELNQIEVFYLPTRAYGCEFQPFTRVEEVRKIGK